MSKEIIGLFKDKYGLNISFENTGTLPNEIQGFYEEVYFTVTSGNKIKRSTLAKILSIVKEYPDIPTMYNLLYNAYILNKNNFEAFKILDETVRRFPDYITANIIKAKYFIGKNKIDEAKEYLGADGDIKSRFPKDLYHVSEILGYYHSYFDLAIMRADADKAEECLRIIFDVMADKNEILDLARQLRMLRLRRRYLQSYQSTDTSGKIRETLDFESEIIDEDIMLSLISEDLYAGWPNSLVEYDKDYLCQELLKVCANCYVYFDSFEYDESDIVVTAFRILAVLEYEDAAPLFIKFITQDEEFTTFWFEDHDEALIEIVFLFARQHPIPFLELVLKEDIDDYIRSHIFEALVQLALHNVILPATVRSCVSRILDTYLPRIGTNDFIPSMFLTFILFDACKLNDKSLIFKAKPFFENELIDLSFNGEFENYIEKVEQFDPVYDKKHFPADLEDLFTQNYLKKNTSRPLSDEDIKILDNIQNPSDPFDKFMMESFFKDISNMDDEAEHYDDVYDEKDFEFYSKGKVMPIVNTEKTGRNDPCPCGSGKKYKKCCLNKKLPF